MIWFWFLFVEVELVLVFHQRRTAWSHMRGQAIGWNWCPHRHQIRRRTSHCSLCGFPSCIQKCKTQPPTPLHKVYVFQKPFPHSHWQCKVGWWHSWFIQLVLSPSRQPSNEKGRRTRGASIAALCFKSMHRLAWQTCALKGIQHIYSEWRPPHQDSTRARFQRGLGQPQTGTSSPMPSLSFPPSSPLPFLTTPTSTNNTPTFRYVLLSSPPSPGQIYHGGPIQLLLSDTSQNATTHLPLPHCYPAAALLLPTAIPPLPAATLLSLPFGTCTHQLNAWLRPIPFCCRYCHFFTLDTSTTAAPSYHALHSPASPDGASMLQLSSTNGPWTPVHLRQP